MGILNRRLRRLEGDGGAGDAWPPGVLAEAFRRASDADMAVILGFAYPEGVARPSSLKDGFWDRLPDEDEAAAIEQILEHVADVRREWGV